MIAVDTSTLVAFLAGETGPDVETLDAALAHDRVRVPPVVVTEILSAPRAPAQVERVILALPTLAIADGYWERAGRLRGRLLARRLRAPLADVLICQSCLDHDLALVTRDDDFARFARHCDLRLA